MATPPSPGSISPSGPAAPAAPPRRRPWLIPVIAVVVVAVVLVAVLSAQIFLRPGTAGTPPPFETFSQAVGAAQSGASRASGGPWTAVGGAALISTLEVTEPSANLTSEEKLANCSVTWVSGQESTLVIPATPSDAPTGAAAFWAFVLKNGSNALLLETVSLGTSNALATLVGGDCATAAGALVAFPSGMPDSPTIVAAANAAGGTGFLGAHANASELWGVIGGYTFLGITTTPEWFVEYTSCSATASPTQVGAVFNATVNGLSAVVTNHTTGQADCALSVSTGPTLAVPTSIVAGLLRKAI
jgi:hypothetical protein